MTAYEIISKKRDGQVLSIDEIKFFINGYTTGDIPDYQMSALLMAIYLKGMNKEETLALTNTFLHSGQVINFEQDAGVKVDKHSTGGVGDKVSIILVPIVAAAGVAVPMISGRSLGHSGGTLDKLESIPGFRVDYNVEDFKEKVRNMGVCLIGQTAELAPADKKIYALRDVTATIQSIPLIAASIMSKKLAEGTDALVLDVKTGNGAFMKEYDQAVQLAKTLIQIGEDAGKTIVAYITDMNNPLGNTVGNWLEIAECIDCMHGNGPADLMEVTHQLAGTMIYLGNKADSIKAGVIKSKDIINNGSAWDKFLEIVRGQEGNTRILQNPDQYPASKYQAELLASQSGWIETIDAYEIGMIALQLGAGRQKSDDKINNQAGIRFYRKTGQTIEKGEPILSLFTDKREFLPFALEKISKTIKISTQKVTAPKLILEYLDKSDI